MKLDHLLAQAGTMGVAVEWHALGARRGDYNDVRRLIRLNEVLTGNQQTDVLAHELGHAFHRDRVTSPAIERRASEYGAQLIISEMEYRLAEGLHGPHPGAIAVELGVTRHMVLAWRRWRAANSHTQEGRQ